jgi:hypothetical protein
MPSPSDRRRDYVAETFRTRIPKILANAAAAVGAEARFGIERLAAAIAEDRPMEMDFSSWPVAGWEGLPARVTGRRPSETPFFDFEFWMYFRILAAVRFEETGVDPFRATKHRDLNRHIEMADAALGRMSTLAEGLRFSLAGNAHDLSQIAGPSEAHDLGVSLLDAAHPELRRLNIIADNFGAEFVADLALAVIAAEAEVEVVLHVKQLPIFVSDTTTDDVNVLLDRLDNSTGFGRRVHAALGLGTMRFATHPFWSAPKFFDEVPVRELGTGPGVLNVLKGDLNFRRAVGDAAVAIETPFETLDVLPAAPLLALRSIKSYCVAGMTAWPEGMSRTDFPMDGSIVAVQEIPARVTASAENS